MKRTIALVAALCLLQTLAFGQKKYEMVIEKTDGTETVINVEDIVRTYFRERTDESGDSVTSCPDGNHPHMIDLGLPSGTKWACCNVGANKPEEYGDYFAWGETKPKDVYDWSTYIHCDGSYDTCHDLGSDIAGKKDYDAATANWGLAWKMPAKEQYKELIDNCTSEWTQQNGIYGRKFIGPNGATIFLPAAGGVSSYVGSRGYYRSSTPYGENYAYELYFNSGDARWSNNLRYSGLSVRPVYTGLSDFELSASTLSMTVGETTTVKITSGNGEYGVTNLNSSIANATLHGTTITINAKAAGNAKIEVKDKHIDQTIIIEVTVTSPCPDGNHPHMIDLGLPSGTKWACCNVGANKPEDYGDHFAWGETKPKDVYDWSTYIHCDGSEETCHDLGYDIAGKKDYDAATANWGSPWKMPTVEQRKELIYNCTSVWTQENGIYGMKFTGSNGATIFLPAAGSVWNDELHGMGHWGDYWSSTPENENYGYRFEFDSGGAYFGRELRKYGLSVRPVR